MHAKKCLSTIQIVLLFFKNTNHSMRGDGFGAEPEMLAITVVIERNFCCADLIGCYHRIPV